MPTACDGCVNPLEVVGPHQPDFDQPGQCFVDIRRLFGRQLEPKDRQVFCQQDAVAVVDQPTCRRHRHDSDAVAL